MSFPVDIPTTLKGYDTSSQYCRAHDYNFEYLGNQYFFGDQGKGSAPLGDFLCHAMKSTDGGATWTEMDPTHAPGLGFTAGNAPGYTVARDGSWRQWACG